MIASLMMYLRPELEPAHTALWANIREALADHGLNSPSYLDTTTEEFSVWQDPSLVLSQTCGMPYRLWLHNQVSLVGTPDYDLGDCPPGYYRSAIVVRADDPRQSLADFQSATFAYNQTFSQSGYAAPYAHFTTAGEWFSSTIQTFAHRQSAISVASGQADIAALDAVSWLMMERYDTFTAELRVLDWTEPTPGLPLISAKGQDHAAIRTAVASAIRTLEPHHREALHLRGIVAISKADYLAIPNPPATVAEYDAIPS